MQAGFADNSAIVGVIEIVKESVEVALIQPDVAWLDPDHNRRHMVGLIDRAVAGRSVDLIVLPELCNTGYVKARDKDFAGRFVEASDAVPGPTTEALADVARRHRLHIVVGLARRHPIIPAAIYNSAVLIDADGAVRHIHSKVHLPTEENHYFCSGAGLEAVATDLGNIGLLVCYDAVFPEAVRVLALRGAEIVCAVFNGPKHDPHVPGRLEYLASVRAMENRNFFLLCNRVGSQEGKVFFGHSVVAGPTGEIIARSETEEEDVVYATLRGDVLVRERAYWPVFRDRHPAVYAPLTESL